MTVHTAQRTVESLGYNAGFPWMHLCTTTEYRNTEIAHLVGRKQWQTAPQG